MSVAPQSLISARRSKSRRPTHALQPIPKKATPKTVRSNTTTKKSSQKVERLPSKRNLPLWLRSLLFLQRSSSFASCCLIGITLALYAWTVYGQQLWSQEYRKLEALQRNERHLTATNEAIKNQLAQQAERPDAGLVPPNPSNMLFLHPAPQRPFKASPSKTPDPKPSPTLPLGY
jgi:hypothetical protein